MLRWGDLTYLKTSGECDEHNLGRILAHRRSLFLCPKPQAITLSQSGQYHVGMKGLFEKVDSQKNDVEVKRLLAASLLIN